MTFERLYYIVPKTRCFVNILFAQIIRFPIGAFQQSGLLVDKKQAVSIMPAAFVIDRFFVETQMKEVINRFRQRMFNHSLALRLIHDFNIDMSLSAGDDDSLTVLGNGGRSTTGGDFY